jgi:hypothetical protein
MRSNTDSSHACSITPFTSLPLSSVSLLIRLASLTSASAPTLPYNGSEYKLVDDDQQRLYITDLVEVA